MTIKNANSILKGPVNKLFPTEYAYHNTNQTDKAREQMLRWEVAVIDELKGGGVFENCKCQSFS